MRRRTRREPFERGLSLVSETIVGREHHWNKRRNLLRRGDRITYRLPNGEIETFVAPRDGKDNFWGHYGTIVLVERRCACCLGKGWCEV